MCNCCMNLPKFPGTNMNFVHFTTSLSMNSHLGGMPTMGFWGKFSAVSCKYKRTSRVWPQKTLCSP